MTSLPPAADGDDPPHDPDWRPPAPDDIPLLAPLLSDEVWQPEQPAGPAPPAHYRIDDVESPWWNGWEWRWDKPGELLGQIPWPYIIRPAAVTGARYLCLVQGSVQIVFGLIASGLLVRRSLLNMSFGGADRVTAVSLAGVLGAAAFAVFFGNALLDMRRGVRVVVTTVEILQIAATVVVIQTNGVPGSYADLVIPLLVLALLWLTPATRHGFTMRGRTVAGPTGDIVMRVVAPRRPRNQVPTYRPAAPLHPPPAHPGHHR